MKGRVKILGLGWALVASWTVPLGAQSFPATQTEMVWDGGNVASIEPGMSPRLELEGAGIKGRSIFNGPEGATSLHFWRGVAWATVPRTEGDRKLVVLLRSTNLKAWESYAQCPAEEGRPLAFYPLEDGRFLSFSGSRGFLKDGKASFWAIHQVDEKGCLRMRSLVDLGLKEPFALVEAPKPPAKNPICQINPKYKTLAAMTLLDGSAPVRVPGAIILVGHRAGMLWVLDEETGFLKRRISLFSQVNEDWLAKTDELEWALLGCQPRSNGHLLLASRSEEAVTRAMKYFGYQTNLKTFKDEAKLKQADDMKTLALERFPEVYWWDLDPATGEMHKEVPPVNVPTKLWDIRTLSKFRFRFKPDGNLLVAY